MEGTSGAAESASLRGDSGEAALGSGGVGLAQAGRRPAVMSAYALRKRAVRLSGSRGLAKAGRAGSHADQRSRSRGPVCEVRSLLTPVRFRPNGARGWVLHPVSRWSHDERCSSVSGRGEAPSTAFERFGARCRAAKAGRPLARRNSAGTEYRHRDGAARRTAMTARRCYSESVVVAADGAPTPSGGFLQVQRKRDAS